MEKRGMSLLFIPCERLEGLLDAGPLGDMPPVVHQRGPALLDEVCEWRRGRGRGKPKRAIAIIWNGTPQPMGIWPLVASMPENASGSHLFGTRTTLMVPAYTVEEATEIARLCEELHGMGRVVVVEAAHE